MTALLVALSLVLGGDTLKTEIIFLGDLPAERAIALWERVIGQAQGATVIQGKSADVIVVRDTPARLDRFKKLMRALATTGAATHVYLRPVNNVTPSELVQLVQQLADHTDALKDVLLVPDDRSDQLVIATTPARYRALDKLFRRLDVPPPARAGGRRVIGVEPEPDGGLPR